MMQRLKAKRVGLLRSGVFPDAEEGIIAVRDVPAVMVEIPRDVLDFEDPYVECDTAMSTKTEDGETGVWIIELELKDGSYGCEIEVPLPERRELCDESYALGLVVIQNQNQDAMLLKFPVLMNA